MQTLIELIGSNIITILGALITGVFSYIGIVLKNLYKKYIDNAIKRSVVESTVSYVEHIGASLTSSKKFQLAIEKSREWLSEKGLKVSDTELEILIESALMSLKQNMVK